MITLQWEGPTGVYVDGVEADRAEVRAWPAASAPEVRVFYVPPGRSRRRGVNLRASELFLLTARLRRIVRAIGNPE